MLAVAGFSAGAAFCLFDDEGFATSSSRARFFEAAVVVVGAILTFWFAFARGAMMLLLCAISRAQLVSGRGKEQLSDGVYWSIER